MIYSVTGRVWNAETRKHDKLQTIDFERRVDATGFMSLNKDWILGMVMDCDAEALAYDKAQETDHKAFMASLYPKAPDGALLTDETDENGIPS